MWCRGARRFARELRHVGHLTTSSGDVAVSVGPGVAVPSELSAVVIGGAGDGDGWGEAGSSGAPTSASEAHGLKIRSAPPLELLLQACFGDFVAAATAQVAEDYGNMHLVFPPAMLVLQPVPPQDKVSSARLQSMAFALPQFGDSQDMPLA
ncbi:unnamed protein product [Closterium sp. NIES-65]|nr:unnamed protein product [Closterium sp. NIES-65]